MMQNKKAWYQRLLKSRRRQEELHIKKRKRRRMLAESLEQRQMLAADVPGDDLASAQVLSLVPNTALVIADQSIGDGNHPARDVDFYKVELAAGQKLSVDVDAEHADDGTSVSTLNSYLRVFDVGGNQLAQNDQAHDASDHHSISEYLDSATNKWVTNTTFPGDKDSHLVFSAPSTGTYYIGVSDNANTDYDPATSDSGTTSASTGQYELHLTADPPAIPEISIGDVTIDEHEGSAEFTVSINPAPLEPIQFAYTTSDDTATSTNDYSAVSGTLSIQPGETTATITVPIINDNVDEPNETFDVTLSAPVNSTLVDATGQATILNDDLQGSDVPGDILETAQQLFTLVPNVQTELVESIGDSTQGSADVDFYKVTLVAGQTITRRCRCGIH